MRFFIALEIPEYSQKQLQVVQSEIKKLAPEARLTDPEKLHLTIAFVGEQADKMQSSLVEVIKKSVQDIPPFEVTPAYLDGFPNLHHPHTIWVGVKGDIDKLFVVRERVKDGLVDLGLEVDERRYIPHIAVAKLNSNYHLNEVQEGEFQKMMMEEFEPIQIDAIKLFESIPEEGFHRHNTLAEVPLVHSESKKADLR
ncbi:RNA 2',3'-cyclic phosphodiesterase [Patescibacteria group bacterium]|nr:RNA 2',3'-cyclic phosphodiesterase [Patescibacteria group bacterium]MCL5410210.1 RNA 2',3'-cyclic phosphodiesterase [Patescibacteria group bacterium]